MVRGASSHWPAIILWAWSVFAGLPLGRFLDGWPLPFLNCSQFSESSSLPCQPFPSTRCPVLSVVLSKGPKPKLVGILPLFLPPEYFSCVYCARFSPLVMPLACAGLSRNSLIFVTLYPATLTPFLCLCDAFENASVQEDCTTLGSMCLIRFYSCYCILPCIMHTHVFGPNFQEKKLCVSIS